LQLAIGLGNPGDEYAGTRHNLGFRVVDLLARRFKARLRSYHGLYLFGRCHMDHLPVGLAKPLTFMNESGHAALELQKRLDINPEDLLVISDDANLPLGKIRLRRGGSDGGHRGLESIISHLATESFPRLRLGIGAPPQEGDLISYVLTEFQPQEQEPVEEMVQLAGEAVICFFQSGIESAMNRFNAQDTV
jgi:PTH1 family peptidyl-tRNA hydrolase